MFGNDYEELNSVPSNCFGALLGMAMLVNEIETYRQFQGILEQKGIYGISERRISEYCNGMYTPPFEKAKQMLEVLNYSITDSELLEALRANREYAKIRPKSYRRKDDREIRISVRLKLSKIMPDQPADRTALIMDERIEHLCGSRNNYTDYIQALINKDLSEYILNLDSIDAIRGEDSKT